MVCYWKIVYMFGIIERKLFLFDLKVLRVVAKFIWFTYETNIYISNKYLSNKYLHIKQIFTYQTIETNIYISNKYLHIKQLENEVRCGKTVKANIYHFQEILEMKNTFKIFISSLKCLCSEKFNSNETL